MQDKPSVAYKYYMLAILILIGVVGSFERYVFALAMEPMKLDLGLSDSQLGLLTGIAFSTFYALAGIPIARWADRGNRVTVSSLAIGILGVMVSLCGMVSNFWQIFLARMGVGIGEAGYVPAAQSLISDYFDRDDRARALAFYFSCFSLSMIVGYLLGGVLIQSIGWRLTFIAIGLPALLVAILAKLTLKEPRLKRGVTSIEDHPSLIGTLKALWLKPSFRQIFGAFCVAYFFSFGYAQWLAVFFVRSHGMDAAEIGGWFALASGVCGVLGSLLGGYYASRFAQRQESLQLKVVALSAFIHMVAGLFVFLPDSSSWALFYVGLGALSGAFASAPVFSIIQAIVPPHMRSISIAILFMFANLIGFGLGPLAVGVLSDMLADSYGNESLRYALIIISPGYLWVAYHYWKAGKYVEEDIRVNEVE